MTDAPSDYEKSFPALDGPDNNNIAARSLTTSSTSSHSNNFANSSSTPSTVINSWSTNSSQNIAGQQSKLNYHHLLLNTDSQHQPIQTYNNNNINNNNNNNNNINNNLTTAQSNQQVESNHPVDTVDNSSAMVSQYHLQPQQPQQQQQQPTTVQSINNNLVNNHTTMQSNPSIKQKRPGLPNPITSSERCSTFKIAPEERRHRDFELEQSKILKEIMQKTGTKIEVTTTKDGALNFCIIGKEASLQTAKNLVLKDFQTSVTLTVPVPKSLHGRLLGPKGARLASIQEETQTKITMPRIEEDSDIIRIVGLKNNAELAVRSIQKYAREFTAKATEKVSVERIYILFITGPFNENLKRWEEMGVKVSTSGGLLPSNNERESGHADEVTFTLMGETAAVNHVKDEIIQIYEDKKKKCTTVNMEVKKAQHKYILGPGGQNLRQLFAKTGVSVELPHESESETITLRGERSKLAPALSELYTQAHSETDDFFEVESWLHKYLIGPRKSNCVDFKARGVDVKSYEDKIKLHGPPTEVENIMDILETELATLRKTIVRKDIRVEPRIHGYIIGKFGATVDQIREESGAYVFVPKNDEPSDYITLEGTEEAVAIAEEKINAIAKKYEASRKLFIDQQLHGSIIGRGGEKIRSIREKFSQIVFTFPEQGSKNNEITILGPTDEVEECYKYLDEFHKQLQENNHQVQVPIRKDVVKYIPDAQQAIRRIKADHKVKVDLFFNNASNDNKTSIQANKLQSNANSTVANTNINQNNETSTNSVDDKVDGQEGGNKKKGGKGKGKKTQQSAETGSSKSEATVGNSNNAVSENYAVVIGKKEDVELAKVKLSKLFDELATTTEFELKMSHKLRTQGYLGPKAKIYRQFLDEFQNKIVVSFSTAGGQQSQQQQKQQQSGSKQAPVSSDEGAAPETNGTTNVGNDKSNAKNNPPRIDIVKIRGPKNIAKKAEKRFEALIAECQEKMDKNYSSQVSVETATIEKFVHADKIRLNKIRETQNVKLLIPDWRETPQLQCAITGYEKNVQAALQQFTKLVKEVEERTEETIEIPSQVHPRLIGAQGRAVKKLMDDYKVGVRFARQGDPNPNAVTLIGSPDCILAAKNHMIKLADQYMSSANRASSNVASNNTSAASNNNNSQQQGTETKAE